MYGLVGTAIIVTAVICGFLSLDLARKKGYPGGTWFACGLFFGILGLIAAAGLPLNRTVKASQKDQDARDTPPSSDSKDLREQFKGPFKSYDDFR